MSSRRSHVHAGLLEQIHRLGRARTAEPDVLRFQCTLGGRPLCRDKRGLFDQLTAARLVGGLGADLVATARGAQVTVRCARRAGGGWSCAGDRGGGSQAIAVE
jgi:hypothetical protein